MGFTNYELTKKEGYNAAKKGYDKDACCYCDANQKRAWLKGWNAYHEEIGTEGDLSLTQAQNKMWS